MLSSPLHLGCPEQSQQSIDRSKVKWVKGDDFVWETKYGLQKILVDMARCNGIFMQQVIILSEYK